MRTSLTRLAAAALLLLPAGTATADTFADVAKYSLKIEPTQAKPGQVVTLKLTVEPSKGYWTYPANADQTSKNKFELPTAGDVIFVEPVKDPPGAKEKPGANLGETDLYYPGPNPVIWEFVAVVSPDATPGAKQIPLKGTQVQVCKDKCLYLRDPQAELDILPGPAEVVPEQYKTAVEKARTSQVPATNPPVAAPTTTPASAVPASADPLRKVAVPLADYTAAMDALKAKMEFGEGPKSVTSGVGGGGGLGGLLVAAAFWGLVSLVTPCVFPMIPITISLFLKQSHQSQAQVLKLAVVYCLTIIAVLGASAVFLLSVFRSLSVDPYMNLLLGGLFVFFALSLFGMYDITLPGFLLRYTEKRRGAGGLFGTVFGALAFSIVSFTCVAPFLGGFAGLAASGNFAQWQLVLAGATFAAAFASPFFVLALFPSLIKKLPKSGGWLDTVKVVMGFLELAAAFKFFRTAELRLLPHPEYFTYDVVLAGWVAIAFAAGLYLLNLYRLPHDEETPNTGVVRLLIGLGFLGLAVYLAPAMLKTAGPGSAGQRPGGVVYAWVDAFLLPDSEPWSADLPGMVAKIREEKATGKPTKGLIFADFTGVTCTNCRYNENNVFTKPEVRGLLQRYALVQVYTDEVPAGVYAAPPSDADRTAEARVNLRFQREAFKDETLPLYAVLEPQVGGAVKVLGVYDEGKINDAARFVEFLKKSLGEK